MRGHSRHFVIGATLLALALGAQAPARAQVGVSVGVSVPGVQIGIHVPAYPDLQPVPEYPVYYAPELPANYFFYDGLYWVYVDDTWYSSSWYDGPWYVVEPAFVPVFILRVPVRYYRAPPPYFRAWIPTAPPRWGAHWGPRWEAEHRGWDRWDRRAAPPPAPLPVYQRQYVGERYPSREQQPAIRAQNYRFEPRDPKVRERVAVESRAAPAHPPRDERARPQAQEWPPDRQAPAPQQRGQRAQQERDQPMRDRQMRDQQAQQQERDRQTRGQQAHQREEREQHAQVQWEAQRAQQQQRAQQMHEQQARPREEREQQGQTQRQQQMRPRQQEEQAERRGGEHGRDRPPGRPQRERGNDREGG